MNNIINRIKSDQLILSLISEKKLNSDELLFDEGDDSHSIFILEIGNVIIEKSINKEKTLFKELAYISAPSFVGEIALFEEMPRTARVRAITECKAIEISKENFKKIFEHRPDLVSEMLLFMSKTLSLRLAHTSKELTLLYDISKHLTETHTDEKEFLTKITEEISIYFNECEIETYYYNPFNEEFEKIYELNPNKNLKIDLKKYTNSTWIDNKSYITVVTPDKMSKSTILYHFDKELTPQEMNDYTTIFNTISYIVSAGLKETSRNKEILLIEKLKKRKGIL